MFCVTQMKKIRSKGKIMQNSQTGRSMMEMLGVLSIIGLLSVGGLAGYSKMMMQYRINTCMQQINIIASKLSAIGSQTSSYAGLNNLSALKFNAVPAETIDNQASGTLMNPFGGSIVISESFLQSDKSDSQAYSITYGSLPQEACIALAAGDWNNSKDSSLLGIGVGSSAEQNIYQGCPGSDMVACPDGETTSLPMDVVKASSACSCQNNCVLVLKFF